MDGLAQQRASDKRIGALISASASASGSVGFLTHLILCVNCLRLV